MNKEDKKLQEDLVNEMMKVSKTNPDVMIYMQSLMKCYEDLVKENQQLKKQKDDAIKFLKSIEMDKTDKYIPLRDYKEFGILLRMLGEKR